MIHTFREKWLEQFFLNDVRSKRIPAELDRRLFRKLQLLDDATSDADLRVPPSNHFERLRGTLAGWCSIRVNDRWRLIFRWNSGEASEVYHAHDQAKAGSRKRSAR
ncbi:MAG: type II toxin-antitoxin system RelE/ParE family toxin [Hyphomicrobiales bacterium]